MGLFTATTKTPAKKNIFISYRVNDTAGETGRLVDSLKQYFYEDQIFMDIEKIEPGVDFTEAISKSLESCDVLLAIIGPNWQGLNAATNTSRINNPNDWVRLEISTALKRNIRVVPVLVDGAELPAPEQLPEDLQPLLRRQAYEISNKRWKYDTEELMRFLIKSVGIPPKTYTSGPVKQEKSWWSKNYLWVIIGGCVLIFFAAFFSNQAKPTTGPVYPKSDYKEDTAKTQVEPAVEAKEYKEYRVDGTWQEADQTYYMVINQNGTNLIIFYYTIEGLLVSQGYGTINNNQVTFNLNVTNVGTLYINAMLSADEQHLNGTVKIENNGGSYSEQLHMTKSAG